MAIFTNQATISYNGTVRNSNITTGEVLEVLSATKTALRGTYLPGETVTYAVSLLNSGTSALTNLSLRDDLGGYVFDENTVYPLSYLDGSGRVFVNGVLQPAPTVEAGPPLTLTGLSIPAGGNLLFVYEAQVTEFAPPTADATITNTVTVTGGCTTVTATETVTAAREPNLTITKSISPSFVSCDSPLTYTFVIQNVGNEEAGEDDNVVVTDIFDPALSDVTVTLNGTVLTGTSYFYNEETGEFATTPGTVTVPAATFTQDPETGRWITEPGVTVLTVTGTL